MKSLPAVLLVINLISVAVFGLILMNHEMAGHGGCMASILSKDMPCAEKADLANYINLHGDFLKKFAGPVAGFLILLTFFVFAVEARKPDPPDYHRRDSFNNYFSRRNFFAKVKFLSGKDFISWLSFSENLYPIF